MIVFKYARLERNNTKSFMTWRLTQEISFDELYDVQLETLEILPGWDLISLSEINPDEDQKNIGYDFFLNGD